VKPEKILLNVALWFDCRDLAPPSQWRRAWATRRRRGSRLQLPARAAPEDTEERNLGSPSLDLYLAFAGLLRSC